MRVIGIDPGLSGGIAVIELDGTLVHAGDLPAFRLEKLSWIDGDSLMSLILSAAPSHRHAVIERVQAMPKQGVSSSFNFGAGFGSVLGVLQALRCPITFASPARWKRDMGLTSDKSLSLNKARLLWPTADLQLKKHEGRAEALLLAAWHVNQQRKIA